jgi:hypothetical protein
VQVNLALHVALSGSVTMLAVGEAKAAPEASGEAVGIHDHRVRAHGVHQLARRRVRALQRKTARSPSANFSPGRPRRPRPSPSMIPNCAI